MPSGNKENHSEPRQEGSCHGRWLQAPPCRGQKSYQLEQSRLEEHSNLHVGLGLYLQHSTNI